MSTFSFSACCLRLAGRAHVEADDDGVGSRGQRDVGLGDAADGGVHDVDACTSDWSILSNASRSASMEPCTSAFTMRFRSVCLPSSMRLNRSSRLIWRLGLLLGQACAQRALLGQLAGIALVLEHAELVAGGRDAVQAQDLDRVGRRCASRHARRAGRPARGRGRRTCRRRRCRPVCSVPRCTSTVATGPRPLSRLASMTKPEASASGLALKLEHVGLQDDGLEQVVDVQLLLRRNVDEHVVCRPTPRG